MLTISWEAVRGGETKRMEGRDPGGTHLSRDAQSPYTERQPTALGGQHLTLAKALFLSFMVFRLHFRHVFIDASLDSPDTWDSQRRAPLNSPLKGWASVLHGFDFIFYDFWLCMWILAIVGCFGAPPTPSHPPPMETAVIWLKLHWLCRSGDFHRAMVDEQAGPSLSRLSSAWRVFCDILSLDPQIKVVPCPQGLISRDVSRHDRYCLGWENHPWLKSHFCWSILGTIDDIKKFPSLQL